jgi:hypothetical protein
MDVQALTLCQAHHQSASVHCSTPTHHQRLRSYRLTLTRCGNFERSIMERKRSWDSEKRLGSVLDRNSNDKMCEHSRRIYDHPRGSPSQRRQLRLHKGPIERISCPGNMMTARFHSEPRLRRGSGLHDRTVDRQLLRFLVMSVNVCENGGCMGGYDA